MLLLSILLLNVTINNGMHIINKQIEYAINIEQWFPLSLMLQATKEQKSMVVKKCQPLVLMLEMAALQFKISRNNNRKADSLAMSVNNNAHGSSTMISEKYDLASFIAIEGANYVLIRSLVVPPIQNCTVHTRKDMIMRGEIDYGMLSTLACVNKMCRNAVYNDTSLWNNLVSDAIKSINSIQNSYTLHSFLRYKIGEFLLFGRTKFREILQDMYNHNSIHETEFYLEENRVLPRSPIQTIRSIIHQFPEKITREIFYTTVYHPLESWADCYSSIEKGNTWQCYGYGGMEAAYFYLIFNNDKCETFKETVHLKIYSRVKKKTIKELTKNQLTNKVYAYRTKSYLDNAYVKGLDYKIKKGFLARTIDTDATITDILNLIQKGYCIDGLLEEIIAHNACEKSVVDWLTQIVAVKDSSILPEQAENIFIMSINLCRPAVLEWVLQQQSNAGKKLITSEIINYCSPSTTDSVEIDIGEHIYSSYHAGPLFWLIYELTSTDNLTEQDKENRFKLIQILKNNGADVSYKYTFRLRGEKDLEYSVMDFIKANPELQKELNSLLP